MRGRRIILGPARRLDPVLLQDVLRAVRTFRRMVSHPALQQQLGEPLVDLRGGGVGQIGRA
jgi:hypothetical protein